MKKRRKPKRRRVNRHCYVFLSEEDFEAIEAIRREKGFSLSATIRMAVKEWLKNRRESS